LHLEAQNGSFFFKKHKLLCSSVCVNNAGLPVHIWMLCYEKQDRNTQHEKIM